MVMFWAEILHILTYTMVTVLARWLSASIIAYQWKPPLLILSPPNPLTHLSGYIALALSGLSLGLLVHPSKV